MKHAKTSITDVPAPALSRRQVLRHLLGAGVVLPWAGILPSGTAFAQSPRTPAAPAGARIGTVTNLSVEDDQFLDDVEKASFQFF